MPAPTDRIRFLCLALPGVTERPSHGEAAWFAANGRQLATMADHHHDDRVAVWVASAPGEQEVLLEAHPDLLFRPPYVGGRGWVGIRLDVPAIDWDLVAALVAGAHAAVGRGPDHDERLNAYWQVRVDRTADVFQAVVSPPRRMRTLV